MFENSDSDTSIDPEEAKDKVSLRINSGQVEVSKLEEKKLPSSQHSPQRNPQGESKMQQNNVTGALKPSLKMPLRASQTTIGPNAGLVKAGGRLSSRIGIVAPVKKQNVKF